MFQSEKKLSGSTQKMNKTDIWVINYFNKCFNLKRGCLVLLRRWTRQIPGSTTTLTNVSIWKEVVWFYSEDEQDRYLRSSTTLTNVSIWKEVAWFYSEDEQDRYLSHQLLLQMFQSEKKFVWFYSEDEQDRYLGHQLL